MNKEELVKKVAKKTKNTQKDVNYILSTILEVIQKTAAKKKRVTLSGFGTFYHSNLKAQIRRNPRTGAEVRVPAKVVPVFIAHKKFKELVTSKRDKK